MALALVCLLSGCVPQEQDTEYAKGLFSELHARNITALREKMDVNLRGSADPSILDKMAALFPPTPPRSVAVVYLKSVRSVTPSDQAVRRVDVSLQYEFADNKWLLANVVWRETASEGKAIEGMHVRPLANSLQEINRFQWQGKRTANYVILVLAIALPLFSIAALIVCIRTPLPRKQKIFWCLGILVGIGQIGVNWTSGAIFVNPLYIQFLSAGWFRAGPLAPHLIAISVPLFAMLFLFRRHQGELGRDEALENSLPSSHSQR